jgi:hypothetical protein
LRGLSRDPLSGLVAEERERSAERSTLDDRSMKCYNAGGTPLVTLSKCLYYIGRMTATTISFRADDQTVSELRQLAGTRNMSDAIRELIHAQYVSRLYEQAALDAERLRDDPADQAEVKAVNEELDEISAW